LRNANHVFSLDIPSGLSFVSDNH